MQHGKLVDLSVFEGNGMTLNQVCTATELSRRYDSHGVAVIATTVSLTAEGNQ